MHILQSKNLIPVSGNETKGNNIASRAPEVFTFLNISVFILEN